MVKTNHRYLCELCGSVFETLNEAKKCEEDHKNDVCFICKKSIIHKLQNPQNAIEVSFCPSYGSKFDEINGYYYTGYICDICFEEAVMKYTRKI